MVRYDNWFEDGVRSLREMGFDPTPEKVYINIPDAKKRLMDGLRYYLGDKVQWRNEYDEIVDWLTNNDGRGLLLMGNCGVGKSLICAKIIPVLIHNRYRKIVGLYFGEEINQHGEAIKNEHLAYLDDVGTEGMSVKYGEKHLYFSEIVDNAEREGHLLIITTNLNVSELAKKYGDRTVDRLRAITKVIVIEGESMRG